MESQPVTTGLTHAAIFLVVRLEEGDAPVVAARDLLGDLSALVRGIGFRSAEGRLSCITGIGAQAWDRLFALPRPAGLHPFEALEGVHKAPSTPGDILFHIRAMRMDLCFELSAAILERLAGLAVVEDEVQGFRYFDQRDLLGFVDGTENPTGPAALKAALIGEEDPAWQGGSYVIVQKYLHDMARWNAIPVEVQERIVGRRKLSDIELAEEEKPSYAHNVLTNIEEDGRQLQIVRDNMPFGRAGQGEFGTYFIGYSCSPARTERMLRNMFIGDPPGNYDRLLDVSTAVTGTLFFVPTADFMDGVPDTPLPAGSTSLGEEASVPAAEVPAAGPEDHGSLGIGSLKEDM